MEEIFAKQIEEAKQDRIDYDKVDDDLLNDARNKRKRNRNQADQPIRDVADDRDEDDDNFRMDLDKADQQFKVKRK